jgi:hypothetical protein
MPLSRVEFPGTAFQWKARQESLLLDQSSCKTHGPSRLAHHFADALVGICGKFNMQMSLNLAPIAGHLLHTTTL